MAWDKKEDTIAVNFPTSIRETAKLTEPTEREVLQTLASVFDPLGIATSILLTGKNIFREICDRKLVRLICCSALDLRKSKVEAVFDQSSKQNQW